MDKFHEDGIPFKYQYILSCEPEENSEKIKEYIDKNQLYRKYEGLSDSPVEYRCLKGKKIGLNIIMIDDTELIISFTSFGGDFYKVLRFDDNKLVNNISSWFSDLWSNAETVKI